MNAQPQKIENHGPDQTEVETKQMDVNLADLVTRAEYDVQIATARKWPRSIKEFHRQALEMVTLNEDIAAECRYALPRAGKVIEGPSVRFAEIILSAWGHTRAGARVVNEDARFVTSQGICHDMQTNTLICFEVRRRITDKHNKRFNDDMIGVTGNAASSIALRNAILRVIPKAFWKPLEDAARQVVIGTVQTLVDRRAKALAVLLKFGVPKERVFAVLGVLGEADITLDHLALLFGLVTAIKEEQITPEAAFPMTSAELEANAAKAAAALQPDAKTPPSPQSNEALDMEIMVGDLITGLEGCKNAADVQSYCEEQAELIGKLDKGPKEVQLKWASAYTKKMGLYEPPLRGKK